MKKKPTAFKELTNQLAQLNRLVTELEHSQQPLSEARQVKLLNEIYIQVTSIELTFFGNTPKAVTATANQLAQLRSSHNILNKWGQPLLFNLLLKNEFELAAELKPFHSALSLKYLNMALATNNAALLTFLLTYGQYPISNLVITIGGKTYPSAIHFCFEQQKRGKVMFDAVTTLVKHNASSLLLTNEDGMPLIYAILKEAEHPFREILYKNHYDLSGSKSFLESLVASLFDCLFQPNLREETRHEIAQRLEYYQLILQILENDIQVFGEKVGRELSEKRALCNNRLISQEMINRIQLDPDVIALAKESYEKESICFKMLNSKGRVQEAFFKKKRLESVEINNSKNLDFASLKKILLDSMKNNLSSFDNLIQCKEQLKPIRQEKISIGINKNSLFYEEVSRMSSAERISLQKQLQEGRAF